jgi:hypothetical protein
MKQAVGEWGIKVNGVAKGQLTRIYHDMKKYLSDGELPVHLI